MTKVAQLLKQFDKEYKGAKVAQMGVLTDTPDRLLTSMFPFDVAAAGGMPEGRVVVIYGPESSLKTTLALKAIIAAQRKYPKRIPAFVDVEGHLDITWAKKLGVDVSRLVHSIPETAEQAVDIACGLLEADDISIVVFDSLAAMATKDELEKSAEDSVMGRHGQAINRFYRQASQTLGRSRMVNADDPTAFKPTLIAINQVRANIGSQSHDPFKQPGGKAFQFASSMTIRLRGVDKFDKSVSSTVPAFKEVTGTIEKKKVPIMSKQFTLMVATLPNPGLGLKEGEVYYWNTLLGYLKSLGLLNEAGKKGWELTHPGTGEILPFKTQDEIKARVYADVEFNTSLCAAVIAKMVGSEEMIEPDE